MKINVGTKYEGGSSVRVEDGDYEVQITDIQSTKGRVNMTFTTSKNQKVYKTFFLLEKDGKTVNDKGMRELADFVTTAMQIEDEEVEVDVKYALGFFLVIYVKNGSYKRTDENGNEVIKHVFNIYTPRRCNGFSDGTAPWIATGSVGEEPEEEYPAAEADADADDTEEEEGDILSRLGV